MNRNRTTDTNQASEDELKVLLESNGWKFYEELNAFRKESKYTIPMFGPRQQTNYDELSAGNYYELKQVIQSAIRTEKLKLLDEVRERVVGGDQPDIGDSSHERNILRREGREELTKLGAEL